MLRAALILILTFSTTAYCQNFEIGVIGGGTNLISDVGRTTYVFPTDFAAGGIFKWNRSQRHSFRFTAMYAQMSARDDQSDDISRVERGLGLNYNLLELSMGIEYTFWEFDLHKDEPQFAPYFHVGVAAFRYDSFGLQEGELVEEGTDTGFAIPFGLGMKFSLSRKLVLGMELGARYTFTDNLDGSNPEIDAAERSFGNLNNNDWYMFSGFTLTYTFGRRPCYYNF